MVNALYSIGFGAAWLLGGDLGMFIGAGWAVLSLFYDVVYVSALRRVFMATTAPTLICAVLVPFLTSGITLGTLSMFAMLTITLLLAFSAAVDRRRMQETVIATESARRAVEATYAAKSRFLSTMSHELRTPVNAIIGFAEILHEDADDDGRTDAASDAQRISQAGRRLLAAIDQVLLISDTDVVHSTTQNEPTNVPQILESVVRQYEPVAASRCSSLTLRCDPSMELVRTDSEKLKQCVGHIVDNACEFGAGKPVEIAPILSVNDSLATLTVVVSDQGVGIPANELNRIFDPFVQADSSQTRAFDGMGLGLAVAQHFASLLGGSIQVESRVGNGSSFRIILPTELVANVKRESLATAA
ncbi:MAG: HAMP domain-containing sensor histidine kinase [Hyphomonadaceae bacterium]|nr:HAMP domain-containing sensor histidine kinase [Hyphomonadaceae bacterium]